MTRSGKVAWLVGLAAIVALSGSAVAKNNEASPRMARSVQSVPPNPERLAQMQHHFTQVSLIHEAVIRGDLPAVRDPAKRLAEMDAPRDVPAASAPYVSAIRQAGRRAAEAKDLASAASAIASMLTSCGDCHRTAGTMPAPATPVRPNVGGVVGHMLEHQRAADEMLQGLIVPSASQWRQGAERLQTAALQPDKLPRDSKLTPQVLKAEDRVHRLADQATAAADTNARAATYAQILTTCAECHGLHGVIWGPRKGP